MFKNTGRFRNQFRNRPVSVISKGYKPGSVLLQRGPVTCENRNRPQKPLPFIQPGGYPPDHQQPTPRLGRAVLQKRTRKSISRAFQHRCTWSCNPQSVRLPALLSAPVGSYSTFSPLPGRFPLKETRSFGGRFLLRMHELTLVWQFHQCGALCCPDFPPLPVRPEAPEAAAEPPCFVLFPLHRRAVVATRHGHLTCKRVRAYFAYPVDTAETVGTENKSEHLAHEIVEFRTILQPFLSVAAILRAFGTRDISMSLNTTPQVTPLLRLLIIAAACAFAFGESAARSAIKPTGGDQIPVRLIFHSNSKEDYLRKTIIAPYPYSANEAS